MKIRLAIYATTAAAAFVMTMATVSAQNAGFDGRYTGALTGSFNGKKNGRCNPFPASLVVKNGKFEMKYNAETTFAGTVGPDGDVYSDGNTANLKGKISGNSVSGYVNSTACSYDLAALKKTGN